MENDIEEEDKRILELYEQGGDSSLEYLAYEDWLDVRT